MSRAPDHDGASTFEHYESLVNSVRDGVYQLDSDGRFVFVNDTIVERTSYPRHELLGSHPSKMVASEDISRVEDGLERLLKSEETSLVVEVNVETATAEVIPVEVHINAIEEGEEFCGTVGVARDITNRFRPGNVRAPGNTGMLTWDFEAESFFCDTRAADLLGVEPLNAATNRGENLDTLVTSIHRADRERVLAGVQEAVDWFAEFEATCRVGIEETRWIRFRGQPEYDESGKPVAFHALLSKMPKGEPHIDRPAAKKLMSSIRAILREVLETDASQQIEDRVCTRLAEISSIEAVCFDRVDADREEIVTRTFVGSDEVREESRLTTLPKAAWKADEVLVEQIAPKGANSKSEAGRSIAAIPLVHEDICYGVISVYTNEPGMLNEIGEFVLGMLGDVIALALAMIDRDAALESDQVVEFELRIPDFLAAQQLPGETLGRFEFDRVMTVSRGTYLVYGSVPEYETEEWQQLTDQIPWIDHTAIRTDLPWGGDRAYCEVRLSSPPVISAITGRGGRIVEGSIDGGDLHLVARVPRLSDIRRVTETIDETFEQAKIVAKRRVRPPDRERFVAATPVGDALTERQYAVLKAAYEKGYFAWPRKTTGGEVAEALGITSSTFSQHIRTAQEEILQAFFEVERNGW